MKKIGVIGIGNTLRADDGIGILLLEKIIERKKEFSKNIDFIDGGTGGISILPIFSNYDIIVIVDAVHFGEKPGEFKWFKPNDVKSEKLPLEFTTHDNDFLKVIKLSKSISKKPKTFFIFGIQPADTSMRKNLSKILKQNLNLILDNLIEKIKSIDED